MRRGINFLEGFEVIRDHCRPGKSHIRKKLVYTSLFLLLPFLFSIMLPPAARSQPSQLCIISAGRQEGQFKIKVKVDTVVLHATVQNSKGILVSGLDRQHFQVFEDGIPQQIGSFSHQDVPVTAGLVVDNSGSMRPKRSKVIAAALAFARSSNPQDQMFVVSFNENVSFGLPPGKLFTDQAAELRVALSRIAADGMTALYDAVGAALEHLKNGDLEKKVLIVISDGEDNASKLSQDQLMALAGESGVIIYTIGLFAEDDPDRDPRVLKQLAKATGGEAFLPGSLKEVVPICERIARDIRNQYTLAYVSANKKQDGTFRTVLVKAGAPGRGRLTVRTRAGYYASRQTSSLPSTGAVCHDESN